MTAEAETTLRGRSFRGAELSEIAFPLGGIGTGTISLGGRGELRDWEIFNRPARVAAAIHVFSRCGPTRGGQPIARVLEPNSCRLHRRRSRDQLAGRRTCHAWRRHLHGTYPFAASTSTTDGLPVRSSSRRTTRSCRSTTASLGLAGRDLRVASAQPGSRAAGCLACLSQLNTVGYAASGYCAAGCRNPASAGNDDGGPTSAQRGRARTPHEPTRLPPRPSARGLGSPWRRRSGATVTFSEHWERSGWFDDLQNFWDDFRDDGRAAPPHLPRRRRRSSRRRDRRSARSVSRRVAHRAGVELPSFLRLALPEPGQLLGSTRDAPGDESVVGKRMENWYATQWPDAWRRPAKPAQRLQPQRHVTRLFRDAMLDSTLPVEVIDAVSSQMSIIRTTTCLRTADGRFHAFEGCNDNAGCCPMNCTHVWNYEQALALPVPGAGADDAADRLRRQHAPGRRAWRSARCCRCHRTRSGACTPAADGQMGSVLKLYREWQISGDEAFLRQLWPARQARSIRLGAAGTADRDGVMEGEQHNTYDIEFYGPNTMCGTLYLGALRAGEADGASPRRAPDADEYRRSSQSRRGERYRPRAVERRVLRAAGAHARAPGGPEGQVPAAPSARASARARQSRVTSTGRAASPTSCSASGSRTSSASATLLPRGARARGRPGDPPPQLPPLGREPRELPAHLRAQRRAALLLCTWPQGRPAALPVPVRRRGLDRHRVRRRRALIYEAEVEDGLEIVRGVPLAARRRASATRGMSSSAATTTRGRSPPGRAAGLAGISTAPRKPGCASRRSFRATTSARCLRPVQPGGGWRLPTHPPRSR